MTARITPLLGYDRAGWEQHLKGLHERLARHRPEPRLYMIADGDARLVCALIESAVGMPPSTDPGGRARELDAEFLTVDRRPITPGKPAP